MDLSDMDQTLKRLRSQISNFAEPGVSIAGHSITSKFTSNAFTSNIGEKLSGIVTKYIIYLPVIIFASLLIVRPSFVYELDQETDEKKMSIKRIILASIVISGIIAAIGFAYLYKNKRG